MRAEWQESITIDAPVETVYRYLADFPRHCEWAQTLERTEQIGPGDSRGVGARFRTIERQALQNDRGPLQPVTSTGGLRARTGCEIRELVPNRRIAWHAYTLPKTGLRSDLLFELAPATHGGTVLTQRIIFYQPAPLRLAFRLVLKASEEEMATKGVAQWEAGLRNIKAILEGTPASPVVPGTAA
jgi:uncharacterized protein YndB with AHSA1/START domain